MKIFLREQNKKVDIRLESVYTVSIRNEKEMTMNFTNPATRPQNELNEFTENVKRLFSASNEYGRYGRQYLVVRLRNGSLVQPEYRAAEHETEEDAFYAEGYRYCWNLDGSSVTSSNYDMMGIEYK